MNDFKIRLFLYDDHQLVTDAIQSYVLKDPRFEVVACCQSIEEVKNRLSIEIPDLIITDVLSDEDAGLSLFEFLTQEYSMVKVVAFTSITNDFVIKSLLDMGVSAVVNKREKIPNLLDKVHSVIFGPQKKRSIMYEYSNLQLTPREKEIVDYMIKGLSAKDIAKLLDSSVHTVNNQKNALLEKFGCANSTELVVKLSQMGLIGIL